MIKFTFGLLLFGTLLIIGCDLIVPVKLPPHESKIVLNALLHPQDPTPIYVSQSKWILEDNSITAKQLTSATITIYENGTPLAHPRYIDTTVTSNPWNEIIEFQGYYLPGFMPKPGVTYRITATNPHLDDVEATVTMPAKPRISELKWERDVLRDQSGRWVSIFRLKIDDPPGEKNYYSLELNAKYTDPLNPQIFEIHPVTLQPTTVNPNIGGFLNLAFFDDELFDGTNAEREFLFGSSGPDFFPSGEQAVITELYVKFRSTDEGFFRFQQDLQKHQTTKDVGFQIFTGEPISVYSNVTGGYGIVAAFTEVRDTL